MKLPISDKILLDLYDLLQKIDESLDLFCPPRTLREVLYSEFYKLKWKYERKRARRQFAQFVYYLKKKGYIKIENLKTKRAIFLTKRGFDKILKIKFKTQEKKKRKDGKYQMLIFDIPEQKRHLRNLFREYLQFLGYKMFQKSIWICPFDVLKETEGIIRKYSLDPYVRIFLIEEIN